MENLIIIVFILNRAISWLATTLRHAPNVRYIIYIEISIPLLLCLTDTSSSLFLQNTDTHAYKHTNMHRTHTHTQTQCYFHKFTPVKQFFFSKALFSVTLWILPILLLFFISHLFSCSCCMPCTCCICGKEHLMCSTWTLSSAWLSTDSSQHLNRGCNLQTCVVFSLYCTVSQNEWPYTWRTVYAHTHTYTHCLPATTK